MLPQVKKVIRLFGKYTLIIPAKLNCHEDGTSGRRVLFISDNAETFIISFEENMKQMDMLPDIWGNIPTVSYQSRRGNKYIHLRRNSDGRIACGFFHIELQNSDGRMLYLPGQMVVADSYKWSNGVEPVLMELIDGLTI